MTVALHISKPAQMIEEVRKNWVHYCRLYGLESPVVIVNNSGGKDSGAVDLIAMRILEGGYRSVAADTGNEHPETIKHLKNLHKQRGGNPVEIVSAIYPQSAFDARRAKVENQWQKKQRILAGEYRGLVMPSLTRSDTRFAESWRKAAKTLGWGEYASPIEAFRSSFIRSGNPFLDMSLLHGGFPMGRQRFCTDELKIRLVYNKILEPLILQDKEIVQWSGVRASESDKRSKYPMFEEDKRCDSGQLYNFLPIHQWSISDVFALHKYFGVKPNPLYTQGMGRVGCMPCILVNKSELLEIAARFPDEIDRVAAWEKQVAMVSRWIHWMIVGHIDRRQFKQSIKVTEKGKEKRRAKALKLGFILNTAVCGITQKHFSNDLDLRVEAYAGTSMLGPRGRIIGGTVYDAVNWSRENKRGGEGDFIAIDPAACSSRYGMCD